MPKEDPETTALKKELTDLIAKVKVNIIMFMYKLFIRFCPFFQLFVE